jgi:predicted dehydrogenase
MEAFAAGILDNKAISPDLDDAMKTHELIFAADKSAETGQPVKLPLAR